MKETKSEEGQGEAIDKEEEEGVVTATRIGRVTGSACLNNTCNNCGRGICIMFKMTRRLQNHHHWERFFRPFMDH